MKNKISAIIIIKNHPPHIFATIDSINDLAYEIIIGKIDVPAGLQNKLSQNKKIKLLDLPSDTRFADLVKENLKRNAGGEYILYLDPDEIFPQSVKKFLHQNLDRFDHFFFPRKNIIFGKWIEHTRWWPDYQLRLFKKNSVIWPATLHPVPTAKGKGFRFEAVSSNAIFHYNYDSIDQFIEKATRYAKFEAELIHEKKKNLTLQDTMRQSISEFIGRFFAYDGYRDGLHGFILSFLQMFYYFLVYCYFWERKKYFTIAKDELIINSKSFFVRSLYETNFWLSRKNLVSTVEKLKARLVNFVINLLR